jgi:cytochrome P450
MDRHKVEYRTGFVELADDYHARCPVAWNDTYQGHWWVSGGPELFDIGRRSDVLSSEHDIRGTGRGYKGTDIPGREEPQFGISFLEMDPPDQRVYRKVLNPFLSPAAAARWKPVVAEVTRACIDEVIESGEIDFVVDLANVVPAVVTMGMLGLPLKDWVVHVDAAHARVYTPPGSPGFERVIELGRRSREALEAGIEEIRQHPRPGIISHLVRAAELEAINAPKEDVMTSIGLLIAGGFDTTTALTAGSLEWLSNHPEERERLSRERETLLDSATEEFLRWVTPAQGNGRTIQADAVIDGADLKEGERLWLSWAMANRDPDLFEDPHNVHLDRTRNRHFSFGIGIHRCIGSNVARAVYKSMLTGVLDRVPDFVCTPGGAVHYDTTGTINGMKKLHATFTPGTRQGPGLEATIEQMQRFIDDEGLADPPAVRRLDAGELIEEAG